MPLNYEKNEAGEYVCGKCGEIKKRQNTMHYHLKKHDGNLGFECNICKKQFLHKNSLDLHKEAKHTEDRKKSMVCTKKDCEFTALTKANMLIHHMRIHYKKESNAILNKSEGLYSCTKCSTDYKSGTAFFYHAYSCLELKVEL